MFSSATYSDRRNGLLQQITDGLILFTGNIDTAFNYKGNPYPFRQDSSFLYYCGIDQPGLAIVIDTATGNTTLYGDEFTIEDIIWIGPHSSLHELAGKSGISDIRPFGDLSARLRSTPVHYLPPYRGDNTLRLAQWLGKTTEEITAGASESLIRAVVSQRVIKSEEEVAQMAWAVSLTGRLHVAVMREADEGLLESDLAAIVHGMCAAEQVVPAYGVILSTQGQILHNHAHDLELLSGQLVLGDFGAESPLHYAGDITRTFPVDRYFTNQQRDIYQLVLNAEESAIRMAAPGIPYRDIHLHAAKLMATGLKDLGLMQGNVDEAVAAGAHALFFPHGLGHMIGLDVHDMEDLGENYVGYAGEVVRSDQFGLAYLRLARTLQPGFVLTVEPGIYFIPALIDLWKSQGKHRDFINYAALDAYRDFGGIRIEDNILITEDGRVVLGEPIPKSIVEIEALRYMV